MSKLMITCPSCEETFSADDALQNHLKAKEAKFQEEIKTKENVRLSSLSLNEGYDFPTNLKEQDPVLVSVLTARGGTLDFEDEIAEDEEEGTEEGTEETTEGADEKPAEDNSSENSGEKSE